MEAVNVDEAFNLLTQNVFDKMDNMGLIARRGSGTLNSSGTMQGSPTMKSNTGQPSRVVNLTDNKQPANDSNKCC